MSITTDLRLYDLETYLFSEISEKYHNGGAFSAFDFFCIIIWKANRAKSKVARRLLVHSGAVDLDTAVQILITQLRQASSHRERLRLLIEEWGFLLPMSSAILTVFYPDEFTIYDYRVCEQLGNFTQIGNWKFERLWMGYQAYVLAVHQHIDEPLNLRDKDRLIWARSFQQHLEQDVSTGFGMLAQESLTSKGE